MRLKDLTGEVFSDLTVVSRAKQNRNGRVAWLCECKCGNTTVVAADHLTRKKNPVKSCGCRRKRKGPENPLWDGVGDISGAWWRRITREIFGKSNRFRVEVSITKEYAWNLYLKQNRRCALSNIPISIGFNPYDRASIDRIDNSKGYVEGNIQWVHVDINFMKRNLSQDYFIAMCKKVAETHSGVCEL